MDTNGNMTCQNLPVMNTAGPGHNAWMMTSTALVLFMTLPGLALFLRRPGAQEKRAVRAGTMLPHHRLGHNPVVDLRIQHGIRPRTIHSGAILEPTHFSKTSNGAPGGVSTAWVSMDVFSCFQLTFAIITPALIIGSIAERMKFKAILVFITLWMFFVYFPLAHMVWSDNGLDERRGKCVRRENQGH